MKKRILVIAILLSILAFFSPFMGISDMHLGFFDADLGYLLGSHDDISDFYAWVLFIGYLPSIILVSFVVIKVDTRLSDLEFENLPSPLNILLIIAIPFNIYLVYYIYTRMAYLEGGRGKSEKKVWYSILSFFGFSAIAYALMYSEILDGNDDFIKTEKPLELSMEEITNNLLKIGELYEKGLLTEEEFNTKRKKYVDLI